MPGHNSSVRTILLVATFVTTPLALVAQPPDAQAFLREVLGFGTTELRELAQGRAVVRSLDAADGREIAIAGAVRVPISPEQYIEQLRDIVAFKRHEAVQQIGVFSTSPRAADAAGLTLNPDHLEDLRHCRLYDCDVQLSREAIARLQAVRWGTPGAAETANRMFRELLAEVAANYARNGDAGLMTYENERPAISVASEFRAMVAAPPAVLQRFPVLERHVAQFPSSPAGAVEDILYWSKEDVGPKVIISVTHMAIYRAGGSPVAYAAASKQLYGSHYFDSSLGLTLLLRDEQPSSVILVYLNRSRIDALDGLLGGLKRAIVRSRARSAMEQTLTRIRQRLPMKVLNQGS